MAGEIFDQPFDPNIQDLQNETPTFQRVLREAIDARLKDVHVALPAKVVAVLDTQRVHVQPLLQRQYKNGDVVDIPVIQDVPVIVPRGTDYWIKLPVAVDDTGLILFSERSIDKWLVQGGKLNPGSPRKFDLSDGIFVPGLYPFSQQIEDVTSDLVIHNADAEIRLQKLGKFKIKSPTEELFQVLSDQLQALIDALIITGIGPQPFTPATVAALTAIKTRLDSLKG